MEKKQLMGVGVIVVLVAVVFMMLFVFKPGENGNAIKAGIGDNFTITMESNPTTGYSWQVAGELDSDLVQLVGSKFVPGETSRIGAPGKEEWVFKAIGEGKTTVSFNYVRPWEKDVIPARTDSFDIVIKK